jgi:adenylate kinase family enzyme
MVIESKIIESLKTAGELYHRLVLLVGKSGSGKTSIIQSLAEQYQTTPININLALSKEMLELTERQRQLRLSEILSKLIKSDEKVVFLDNMELLFDTNLKLDPLRLLQGLSRNQTILASWNGTLDKNRLTYAELGHCEYRSYDLSEAQIIAISMNN